MSETLCAICLEDLGFTEDSQHLPCSHLFHSGCIKGWLEDRGTCPTCRYVVVPRPEDRDSDMDDETFERILPILYEMHEQRQRIQQIFSEIPRAEPYILSAPVAATVPALPNIASINDTDPEEYVCVVQTDTRNTVFRCARELVRLVQTQVGDDLERCLGALYFAEGDVVTAILHLTQ